MDKIEKKEIREPKINSYYEIVKDKLIIHNLSVNPDFRRKLYSRRINEYSLYGIATGIWGDEKRTPIENWDGSIKIPWRKTRPFEDLLDPNNQDAITDIDASSMLGISRERIVKFDVTQPLHDWQFDEEEVAHRFYDGSIKELQEECFQDYLYGVKSQPILVRNFIQEDMFLGGDDGDKYMVPTRQYIDLCKDIAHTPGLIPGIIIVKTDAEVDAQLLNCGDYKKFLERNSQSSPSRDLGRNFVYSSTIQFNLDDLSEKEKQDAIEKAKQDKPVLKVLKQVIHFYH